MIFKKSILVPVLLLVVQLASAQGKISIRASIDKKTIVIGERMELTIEAMAPLKGTLRFPLIDTIPHFEFAGERKIDSTVSGNFKTIKITYPITSFDSGHWVIPSFTLTKNIKTDTIPVDVVFSEFDPAIDYHDIKDILEVEAAKEKNRWWWYAGGGLLLLLAVLYVLMRKKPMVRPGIPKLIVNPYDEALKELALLEKKKPEAKQYYSKLAEILRVYVFEKKGILSLQKTTDDLVLQLRELNLPKDKFDKLAQSLRLSDFVKFAKYIPAEEEDKTAHRNISEAIKLIEQPGS